MSRYVSLLLFFFFFDSVRRVGIGKRSVLLGRGTREEVLAAM